MPVVMGHEDLKRTVRYEIDDLTFDVGQCQLRRGQQPIPLTRLNFLLLRCLVEAAPNVVSHADLATAVWGARRVITQENLGKRIMLLRQTLGDAAERPRYIEGMRGLGYRLAANVRRNEVALDPPAAVSPPVASPASRPPAFHAERGPHARFAAARALALLAALAVLVHGDGSGVDEPVAPGRISVAVLPFGDESPNGGYAHLSSGIADVVLNKLAEVKELRVVGRTSSFALAERGASLSHISRALDVTHVVQGSAEVDGDRLRIAARLVAAPSGDLLWSDDFVGNVREVFAFQDEIAARVTNELVPAAELTPVERTPEPAVYAAYLKARHIHRNLILASLPQARSLLEWVVEQDPNYFPARAQLVASYNILVGAGLLEPASAEKLLRRTIDDAAAIWPGRPEIDFWRGWFAINYERDLAAAARLFESALRAPTDLNALSVLVDFAIFLGRTDDAIAIGEHILERDPVCFFCYHNLMSAYQRAERYDKVRELYLAARDLGFDQPQLTMRYGLALIELNEPAEALRQFDAMDWSGMPRVPKLVAYSLAYWLLDRMPEFNDTFAQLREIDPLNAAAVHAFTGDLAAAFAIFAAQPTLRPQFFDGRVGDAMRKHERWSELAAKAGVWPEDPRKDIRFDVAFLR
jgi:TolB-like protein/DNA-binding winged helix-turn-helix (wHTH) protein/tetratricopeptide (TPR) repeat protein